MKILMLTLVAAVMMWCAGPERQAPDKVNEHETAANYRTDTLIPPKKTDNIRFLQRVGGKLIYNQYWSGPLILATFHDPSSGKLLKTVNVRDRNPYLNIGFKIKHYEGDEQDDGIFIHSDKAPHKSKIRAYLPQYLYDEIPDDWGFSEGITMCMVGRKWAEAERYIPIYYLMEWAPAEEHQFMGNYGVTMVTIFDSTGTEVYRRQFDCILTDALVSDDGKYLAITYTFYPETGNDSIPRLKNYAELIYLPEDKSVWKDSTPLHYEEFFFTLHHNYIEIKKIKKREDIYHLWVLSTGTNDLYYRHMMESQWRGGITNIKNGSIIRQLPNEAGAQMNLNNNFQTKNLLDQ